MMAAAEGPELDRRDPGPHERDGIRGAVAAHHAPHAAVAVRRRGLAQRPHVGGVGVDQDGGPGEARDHPRPGHLANLREYLLRVLLRQIAHVHVYDTAVGDLVQGVAAEDAAEVYRRPMEELRALARKR